MGLHKKKKKQPNQAADFESKDLVFAPHSFVIHRGKIGSTMMDLLRDFRKVLEPFTASHLKVKKKNSIKDFVSAAGPLHVSHLVVFTKGDSSPYIRFCKLPRGPTLTFRINDFALTRDVISSLQKPLTHDKQFNHAPLLIMNNFSGEGFHLQLMARVFQNMIPAINIAKMKISDTRRCLLLSYDSDGILHLRHYAIAVTPTGVSKKVKKLLLSKIPDLSKFEDISEYVLKNEDLSESEAELEENEVELTQKVPARGGKSSKKSAVKLVELGPRMTLELVKIEDDVMQGTVLHHQFIVKTEEEKLAINENRERKKKEKERRRKLQERNRKKNLELKEQHKKKSLAGMNKKVALDESDDDAQWFRQEVGTDPEKDLGLHSNRKRKMADSCSDEPKKKFASQNVSTFKSKKMLQTVKTGKFFRKKSTASIKSSYKN